MSILISYERHVDVYAECKTNKLFKWSAAMYIATVAGRLEKLKNNMFRKKKRNPFKV